MLDVCGRENVGLHLCWQTAQEAALEMGLLAPIHCGRISLQWLAGGTSARLGWHELEVGAASEHRECAAALWFPKLSFGLLHFHCNRQLQCTVVGTALLLEPMQRRKPGEVQEEGNIYPLNVIS